MADYRPLFSVRVRHESFGDNAGRCLEFLPTSACSQVLDKSELLWRNVADGLVVFYDAERLAALEPAAHLDFQVHCRDDRFHFYTESCSGGADRASQQILFFDAAKAAADGRLSRDDYVGAADLVPLATLSGDWSLRGMPPLMCVRIATGLAEAGERHYHLDFRARRTVWLYYLSGRGVEGESLRIEDGAGRLEFAYDGECQLPGGRSACRFRSTAAHALLREPNMRLSLRERFNGRVLVRHLPTPDPSALAWENLGTGRVQVSKVFVSL